VKREDVIRVILKCAIFLACGTLIYCVSETVSPHKSETESTPIKKVSGLYRRINSQIDTLNTDFCRQLEDATLTSPVGAAWAICRSLHTVRDLRPAARNLAALIPNPKDIGEATVHFIQQPEATAILQIWGYWPNLLKQPPSLPSALIWLMYAYAFGIALVSFFEAFDSQTKLSRRIALGALSLSVFYLGVPFVALILLALNGALRAFVIFFLILLFFVLCSLEPLKEKLIDWLTDNVFELWSKRRVDNAETPTLETPSSNTMPGEASKSAVSVQQPTASSTEKTKSALPPKAKSAVRRKKASSTTKTKNPPQNTDNKTSVRTRSRKPKPD
jgi:hypothetical protein